MNALQAKKHKQTNDKQVAILERELEGMSVHKQVVNVNQQGYAKIAKGLKK